MFDLITGTMERPLRERAPGSKVTSIVLHVVVLTLVVGIPLLRVTNTLPEAPTMMAFAAAPPAPPPPPPPPPPPAPGPPRRPAPRPVEEPVQTQPDRLTVPIEAPVEELKAEATTGAASGGAGVEGGVLGGVEGGVVGGVLGGIVGGIVSTVPPPPTTAARSRRSSSRRRTNQHAGAAAPRRARLPGCSRSSAIDRHGDSRGGRRHQWIRRVGQAAESAQRAARQGRHHRAQAVEVYATRPERHPDALHTDGDVYVRYSVNPSGAHVIGRTNRADRVGICGPCVERGSAIPAARQRM